MYKMDKPILNVLKGEKPKHIPIWLMRQAGRYLPEYRQLRSKAKNFLNMCLTPEWATEITLQPIRRYNLDAAILFADILLVPMALGLHLDFKEGEGPLLQAIEDETSLEILAFDDKKLAPVYETVSRVKEKLDHSVALIGFCGAPWTVACYMIDGNSGGNFIKSKTWVHQRKDLLDKLLNKIIDASEIYLSKQVEAGAEVLQIFDSWAGLLQGNDFSRYVIEPTYKLVSRLKEKYPDIPIIGFPREAKELYEPYIKQTKVDALSIDYNVDLDWALQHLKTIKPLQGNLNPEILIKGGEPMTKAAEIILSKMGPQHIFNLGHGVTPLTPPENVSQLVEFVHNWKV